MVAYLAVEVIIFKEGRKHDIHIFRSNQTGKLDTYLECFGEFLGVGLPDRFSELLFPEFFDMLVGWRRNLTELWRSWVRGRSERNNNGKSKKLNDIKI